MVCLLLTLRLPPWTVLGTSFKYRSDINRLTHVQKAFWDNPRHVSCCPLSLELAIEVVGQESHHTKLTLRASFRPGEHFWWDQPGQYVLALLSLCVRNHTYEGRCQRDCELSGNSVYCDPLDNNFCGWISHFQIMCCTLLCLLNCKAFDKGAYSERKARRHQNHNIKRRRRAAGQRGGPITHEELCNMICLAGKVLLSLYLHCIKGRSPLSDS